MKARKVSASESYKNSFLAALHPRFFEQGKQMIEQAEREAIAKATAEQERRNRALIRMKEIWQQHTDK